MLMSTTVGEAVTGSGTDAGGQAVVDDRLKAFLEALTTKKRAHGTLVMEGMATHCGHCHQPLTDSLSVERSLGPICAGKGYLEDPVDGDLTDAMIALAEYPQLVEFLMAHSDKGNLRGLMNALVKVCALNRRNANLHAACCDAIQALGWSRLANAMRESIAVVVIKVSTDSPGCHEVRVKGHAWSYAWNRDVMEIPGAMKRKRPNAHVLIPIHAPTDPSRPIGGRVDGIMMSNKAALWRCMLRHYSGYCAKTPNGGVKILEKVKP